jgi:tripartite-type tricarboxylate transporter receptor subunit TctC
MNSALARSLISVLILAVTGFAQAQDEAAKGYPSKPVRIIVGLAAGGGTDLIARMMAPKLSEALGKPFLVENRPSIDAIVGAEYVAKSPPDGYTLAFAPQGVMVTNVVMRAKLPYSPNDFVPISIACTYPSILAVDASLPVRSVPDLIAYLKANPNKANASFSGAGYRLALELFKGRTGTQFETVQYKGANDVVTALMSGTTQLTLVDTAPILGALKGGRARALAVTTPNRVADFPDVPTMAEVGFPDLEIRYWMGFFAPTGTSMPIVRKLEAEINRIVKLPDIREGMRAKMVDASGSSSEEMRASIAKEYARWEAVRKAANIQPTE